MKMKQTYKTKHPTIKEISIGDQFICNNGTIVTFISYVKNDLISPLKMDVGWYSIELKIHGLFNNQYDIKERYITLKNKIDLL